MDNQSVCVLRAACASDQPAITQLIRQARINPRGLHWQRFVVVEERDGRGPRALVGVAQVKPHRDGTRELASLAVVPERQGQGIGGVLVRTLLARQYAPLYLMCLDRMEPYYARFGFQRLPAGREPGYYRTIVRVFNTLLWLIGRRMRVIAMINEQPNNIQGRSAGADGAPARVPTVSV
jgi:N-acetylglutamate synthase-like GNAT family acetyltransferase